MTLSCPACRARLPVTSDLDRLVCKLCGNEHSVERSGGIVSLKPVPKRLDRVRMGVEMTASDPEIKRLTDEIRFLETALATKKNRRIAIEMWVGFGLIILFKGGLVLIIAACFLTGPDPDRFIALLIGLAMLGCALHIVGKFSLFGFTNKKYMPDKTQEFIIEKQIAEKRAQLAKLRESVELNESGRGQGSLGRHTPAC